MPLPDSGHAATASRLLAWFAVARWPPDQLLQAAGIEIPGPGGVGGRIPDLTVWAGPQLPGSWSPITDLLLVAEIVSPGSAAMDRLLRTTPGDHHIRS